MKTVEKELHKFNFHQILIDMNRNRRTGTLTIDTADVTKKVYIDKGNAVFASSTDEDDRLGEMLIKLGKITIEQYDRSVELLKETGKRQGTILVELGYLTPKDLVLGVKAQVREIMYSLFQVEYAEYEFHEGPLPTREVITLQMSMGNLLYEGMKRINNVVRIKRDMPEMNTVLKLNDDPESIFQDIVLTPRDNAMLAMIDGTKTIKELIDSTPTATFEAMKTLYILYFAGFIVEHIKSQVSGEQNMLQDATDQSIMSEGNTFEEQVNELFANLYKLNAHEILGIDETSDEKAVHENYYRMIKEFHPDRSISSNDPLMLDKLITISEEIQNAYVLLKEDDKRRDYFEAISKKGLQEESNTYNEEDFRTELTRVNEELLCPKDESYDTEIEGRHNGEYLYDIPTDAHSLNADYTIEEQSGGVTAKADEEIFSLHGAADEMDGEEEMRRRSLYDMQSDELATGLDETYEKLTKNDAGERDEEISFSHREIIGADAEAHCDDDSLPSETGESKSMIAGSQNSSADIAEVVSDEETMPMSGQQHERTERRKCKRCNLDRNKVNGEMILSRVVTVLDMSVGGIALKVDRQLRIGSEIFLNLHDKDKIITVEAGVVRSALSESESDSLGNVIPIYTVGLEFKNISQRLTNEIAEFIYNHKIDEVRMDSGYFLSGTRSYVRFQIDSQDKNILDVKTNYTIKVLSMSGMLIESDQAAYVNDTAHLEMFLCDNASVSFLGRIVSCETIPTDPERHDIAIEFMEFSDENRKKLQAFLDEITKLHHLEVEPDRSDVRNDESSAQQQRFGRESETILDSKEYDRDDEADDGSLSGEALNRELVNLIGEIKLLLAQIRDELPGVDRYHIPDSKKTELEEETKTISGEAIIETASSSETNEDPEPAGLQEEDESEFLKVTSRKKKLKLWYVLVPALFLMAATITFLLVYTPEKQKVSTQKIQPVQTKKDLLPDVPRTPETPMVSAPEVKKTSPAVSVQSDPHTIELLATDTTWLSAAIDEKESKEMILKPGEKIKWTAKDRVSLVIGNAAGLKIFFDGKEVSAPGGKGKVIKVKLP